MRAGTPRLLAVLAMLWASASAGSGQPIDPNDPQYQYGVNMARQICGSIAAELRDRWLYYDNFRSYRITLSVGGPVESYGCTIAATQINTGEVREVRVDIDRREGSERFSYRIIPELGMFPGCREEQMLDCVPGR